ncbi:MAG: DUF934 domain-containing protein [Hyphomicrobiales bacterium]|nr:DUF934 domain-containing protein [Hyphomicrobiales bacterium]MDE2016223.1 DUF934 domain-containing protein [Hyphomicrobiales bacterium]
MAIWTRHGFKDIDPWRPLAPGDLDDGVSPVVVGAALWRERAEALTTREGPVGLRIEPGEEVGDLVALSRRFALIALAFPKFADGRPYSTARLLRRRGYEGELRAVGDVVYDSLPHMMRCGFDSFEVTDPRSLATLRRVNAPAAVALHYQPGFSGDVAVGGRPWLRRPAG